AAATTAATSTTLATCRTLTPEQANRASGRWFEAPVHAPIEVHERLAAVPAAANQVADQDRVVVQLEQRLAAAAEVRDRPGEVGHVVVPGPVDPVELVLDERREDVGQALLVRAEDVHAE